ncbi:protein kinase domain-containing protein [Streptomyces stelliscabiei]|uniref:protein kinase domain-containing protein n=1 Tax=Streptomyces stelliscabiei TaxID=146820 RepID=UPI0029B73BBC|nr:protein kinase [Streptomyces stelliscabiei]MDX2557274.1 protein kinase [Streptomyces stelliscabiei]MDX2616336.1 protein kinase [Streptomyces stelliscabiei]MDX2641037.1 protein kinase [Streptomyces stelliscabiei]MDX2665099.1 protein kinase [Streptomyces stelliscabiei]MDX2716226.1 protein kinase [Streptomyces stelliscabiei]
MSPREHEDGMRHEPTLSADEKADGFAAVMKRLKCHSPDERARLMTQAEAVALGHEAYALGQEYLDRGDFEAARRWLRVAAGHHIPGAAQALEEIALQQALDGFTDGAAVGGDHAAAGTVPCETIPSPHGPRAKYGQHRFDGLAWASFTDQFNGDQTLAVARAQARCEAESILAEARQEADRVAAACATMMLDIEKERQQAAKLLAEARQEAESVRSQVAEIAEEARRSTDELLAKARREARLLLDDAREEVTRIRNWARRQGSASNRAGTQAEADSVRVFRGVFVSDPLMECAAPPADYVVDRLLTDAQDGSVRRSTAQAAINPVLYRRLRWRMETARRVRDARAAESGDTRTDGVPPWPPTLYVSGCETVQPRQWLLEVAEALQALHSEGTEHRDLKPANLMVAPDGVVRVLDFGLRLDSGDYSGSATSEAIWRDGQVREADDVDGSGDTELGVSGAGKSAGR